jgi:two-component system chemotaxis response regulator CheB
MVHAAHQDLAEAPRHREESGGGDVSVRVMVVDDSAVLRGLVTRWIGEEPGLEIVASASNGKDAAEIAAAAAPDIVLLDVEMPHMGGLESLPQILKAAPSTKVLMVSALTQRNAQATFHALSLGAIDYLPKPVAGQTALLHQGFREELIGKIRALTKADCQPSAVTSDFAEALSKRSVDPALLRPFSKAKPAILAIGSSTGGPQALIQLLTPLRDKLATLPVLVVQHMPPVFTAILADRLAKATGLPAKEAEDGETVVPGHIYVAPGDRHMGLTASGVTRIAIDDSPPRQFHRPAVDVTFEAAAAAFGPATLAVVLTGMGQDGLKGAREIAAKRGSIIVQDARSSVVWGMPGVVYVAGLASAALPPERLAITIERLLKGERA